jgi:hypothetical protein
MKVMKLPIKSQDWDLNVQKYDLNQLAAFQQELPRRLSGTGRDHKIYWESSIALRQA